MPTSAVTLAPNDYLIVDLVDASLSSLSSWPCARNGRSRSTVRVVVDGRTYVRVVDGILGHAGRWVEIAPTSALVEASAIRLLSRVPRTTRAQITLGRDQPMFRFDNAGRVIDRQEVGDLDGGPLPTVETVNVGGSQFFVVAGGDLEGWAVADGSSVTVSELQVADPS